jgi:gamma-glutamyltranspeptidase/glutathione hydrolase
MPPPSSGGLTLALIANILEGFDIAGLSWHSPEALHVSAEAMRRAFAFRNQYLGDPDFVEIPTEMFVSKGRAALQRSNISLDSATPSSEISVSLGTDDSEGDHTTHFSVVDGGGYAVALTTTINLSHGSAVTVKGAGFLLNNEMDDFAAKPGAPNTFGLIQGEANAIAPGKRMLSSMTPVIVVRNGATLLVTGASGGPRIITGVFQVISNVVDHSMDISEALSAPRIHHQHLPDRVLYEKGGLTQEQIAGLVERGHEVVPRETGIAVAASILRMGPFSTGAPDPRVKGLAQGL